MSNNELTEDFVRWPVRGGWYGWHGGWPRYGAGWYAGWPAYQRPTAIVVQQPAPQPVVQPQIIQAPPVAQQDDNMPMYMVGFAFIVVIILLAMRK